MKTSFDTDVLLYQLLSANTELKGLISGGIYKNERPDSSEKQDIVINTITLTGDGVPQRGASNINIYAPDISVKIAGKLQRKVDAEKLSTLTNKVLTILEAASFQGLSFWVSNQSVIKEPELFQHFSNIKIEWNIIHS